MNQFDELHTKIINVET